MPSAISEMMSEATVCNRRSGRGLLNVSLTSDPHRADELIYMILNEQLDEDTEDLGCCYQKGEFLARVVQFSASATPPRGFLLACDWRVV